MAQAAVHGIVTFVSARYREEMRSRKYRVILSKTSASVRETLDPKPNQLPDAAAI